MKKSYVKPELVYESFVLNQHIAACGYQIDSADVNNCKIITDRNEDDYEDTVGGFANKTACVFEFEIYCYTNGQAGYNIFQS